MIFELSSFLFYLVLSAFRVNLLQKLEVRYGRPVINRFIILQLSSMSILPITTEKNLPPLIIVAAMISRGGVIFSMSVLLCPVIN